MEKDPVHRYQTLRLLGEDLRRFCLGKPIAARQVPTTERLTRWVRRNPLVAGILFFVVTLSVAVAVVATIGNLRTQHALSEKVAATIQLNVEKTASYRNLYSAQMHMANQHWNSSRCDSMYTLLGQHLPDANHPDLHCSLAIELGEEPGIVASAYSERALCRLCGARVIQALLDRMFGSRRC